MQINRLFEIIYLLMNKPNITAKNLADHFEVSTRTIYRDVEILSGAGIPIYMNKGKGGGIRLMEHFVLNKSVLSEQEQQEILSALQGVGAINYSETDGVLSKLSLLFHKNAENWIEVDFSDWSGTNDKWRIIKAAILQHQVLSFDYYSSYGEKTHRLVMPVKLWFKERNWYLRAYCVHKKSIRTFKLTRMQTLTLTQETFEPIWEEEHLNSSVSPNVELITVRLKIHPSQSYRVYDEFDESNLTKDEDGNFIATATFPDGEWVYGYLLSFGHYMEVLDPPNIRKQISFRLKKSFEQYL